MTLISTFLLVAAPLATTAQLIIDLEAATSPALQHSEVPPATAASGTDIRSGVKLCDATVQQHSGYVNFKGRGDAEKSYFFWMFESRDQPSEDPLVIWLNGGPGCSSLMGMLTENGPCSIKQNGSMVWNEHSWTQKANVIWVDQPAGAGFSSGAYDYGEEGVGEDFYAFLQGFFENLPQYKGKELFITGESYAGHYIPAIAHHIYSMNKKAGEDSRINLKGIAIGNGLTDVEEQYKWYPQMALDGGKEEGGSLEEGVITNGVAIELMKGGYWMCKQMIKACNRGWTAACLDAFVRCNYAETVPYQLTRYNPYDMRIKCEHLPLCYDFSQVTSFLNRPEVQNEIGAKGSWSSCNMVVNKLLMADFMRSYHQLIPDLLAADIDVLIYAGDVDYICNWLGNKAWTLNLEWEGKQAFNEADDEDYKLKDKSMGRIRSHRNFHFMQVYNAGHMVPTDQPEVAVDMLNKFLAGGMRTSPSSPQHEAQEETTSAGLSVDPVVDEALIAELKAALDAANATAPKEHGHGGRKGHEWHRGETCCMCSSRLPHLGRLLYSAGDYSHDDYGSHNAQWHCEHVCRDQCHWKGDGGYFGCYDEEHIRSVSRQYSHRAGFHIWQESDGEIC